MKKTALMVLWLPFILFASCGSSSSSGTNGGGGGDGGGDGGGGGEDVIITTAGSVFPIDLVVTSPYTQATSQTSISAGKAIQDFSTERTELQGIIEGDQAADCAFTLKLFEAAMASPECYGPQLSCENHPDGGGSCSLPGGDVGIWNENQGSEACAAAKINQLVDAVGSKVDSAVSIFASIACSLNVNNLALPEAGQSLDLKEEFEAILAQNHISGVIPSTVTFSRAAADADGHPVYDFAFVGSASSGGSSRNVELFLRHIPLDQENATYKGKLSYNFPFTDGQGGSQSDAGSILYHKSAATSLVYRFQGATYVANPDLTVDPLNDSNRDIDPTLIQTDDSAHGWANNFNYALFSIDPQDGTGSYAYAWSAGNGDEYTRVFNATLEEDGNTKDGCAYYGFGPQAKGNRDLGTISGLICNWAGPGNQHNPANLVQRQCVAESDAGLFATDTSAGHELKIRYAPTNSCNYAGGSFWYKSQSGTMTNDVSAPQASFENDLLPRSQMSFTMPSVPADVY